MVLRFVEKWLFEWVMLWMRKDWSLFVSGLRFEGVSRCRFLGLFIRLRRDVWDSMLMLVM